ncbi:hypothetical protein [Wenyingzhuangia sp. IMCC45574]
MENIDSIAKAYFIAKKFVINKGFSSEIDWQEEICFSSMSSEVFLKEYSWVVLASGLSDNVVSKVFPKIEKVLKSWKNLNYIVTNYDRLNKKLLTIFNNKLKIKAILDTSIIIGSIGVESVKSEIQEKGIKYLESFKFIGKITRYHLAKNIGLAFAKPDRHLIRISKKIGFESPHLLCSAISDYISEKIQVVDLVLWRYATIDKDYEKKIEKLNLSFRDD